MNLKLGIIQKDKRIKCLESVGANVGLAITQATNLIGICNWGLRQTAEMENQMTSVERVIEYATETSEGPLETKKELVNESWPKRGTIKFKNVSLKYSQDSEYVLRRVNFEIKENVSAIYYLKPFRLKSFLWII